MRFVISILSAAITLTSTAAAQQGNPLTEVCASLANNKVIATQSSTATEASAKDQFDQFCERRDKIEDRFKSRSAGFRGAFKAIDIGGGSNSSSTLSRADIEARCNAGREQFAAFYTEQQSTALTTYFADQALSCVQSLSGRDIIFGYTTPHASDPSKFHAQFFRPSGVESSLWKFIGFTQGDLPCDKQTGGVSPFGMVVGSQFAVTCSKSKDGSHTGAINGYFLFSRPRDGEQVQKSVEFFVQGAVVDRATELQQQIDQLRTAIAESRSELQSLRASDRSTEAKYRETDRNLSAVQNKLRNVTAAKIFPRLSSNGIRGCLRRLYGSSSGNARPATVMNCFKEVHDKCRAEGFDAGFVSGDRDDFRSLSVVCVNTGRLAP